MTANNKTLLSIYDKPLTTKKNILESTLVVRAAKDNFTEEELQGIYTEIYISIEKMCEIVKPNTIMQLKNDLKKNLGKFVTNKDPKRTNLFIEFFKETYPPNNRRKDFTWVLMDYNKITYDQIWNTLVYINRLCLKENKIITKEEKADIVPFIDRLLASNDNKYINQIKGLMDLRNELNIDIVTIENEDNILKVKDRK